MTLFRLKVNKFPDEKRDRKGKTAEGNFQHEIKAAEAEHLHDAYARKGGKAARYEPSVLARVVFGLFYRPLGDGALRENPQSALL